MTWPFCDEAAVPEASGQQETINRLEMDLLSLSEDVVNLRKALPDAKKLRKLAEFMTCRKIQEALTYFTWKEHEIENDLNGWAKSVEDVLRIT